MTKEEIFASLKEIMTENFELSPEKIILEANLGTDLDLDSIDAIDMVSEVQRNLKCRFTPEDFRSVKTVGDIVEVIYKKLEAA